MNRSGSKFCMACAGEFEHEHELLFTFRERQDWKDKKSPFTFSTTDLERMYFQVPWIWSTLFRAFIPTDPHSLRDGQFSRQQFRLSGVGQTGFWDRRNSVTAPLDESLVQIGPPDEEDDDDKKSPPRKQKQKRGTQFFYPALICYPGARMLLPVAYFIHERCWQLARRMIGSSTLEANLDLFVISFHHTWEHIRPAYGQSECFLYDRAMWDVSADEFLENPGKYLQKHIARFDNDPEHILIRDPVNIPELRELVNEATQRRQKEPQTQSSPEGGLELCFIPLDLQCLVVNALESWKDISSVLIAFRWWLPDGYWRVRFPKEIVFEYEHLIYQEVDWQYLYLGTLRLFETSHGLRHRQLIMENLGVMCHAFWDLMKEHGKQKSDCGS